jgi:hypothetical protein
VRGLSIPDLAPRKTDKDWANTCRQLVVKLVVKLDDGPTHLASFKVVKYV